MKNLAFATLFLFLLTVFGISIKIDAYATKPSFEPMSFNWTDADLISVFMLNASDGWAVGQSGTILHWDGIAWKTVESPTTSSLMSIHMVNATDGWAVGVNGAIIHWNGTAWSSVTSPTLDNLYGVYMVNATEGWAVGGTTGWSAVILRWNGTAWNEVTSPIGKWLKSVFMINATDGWTVSGFGHILHWDGTVWVNVTSPTSSSYRSVFMVNSMEGWATCVNGQIVHWNGTAWSNFTKPTSYTLESVFMLNATDGWIVGSQDILHWNGTTWNSVTKPVTNKLFSVSMVNANDGWAVGELGTVLHWNGTEWVVSKSPVYLGDLYLSGSDVYVIEGVFSINGSIIVEENATLILRNAILNFTQTTHHQFGMTFQNPQDGNPRLIVDNASILTNNYAFGVDLWDNSTAEINKLFTNEYIEFSLFANSSISISNSVCPHSHISAQQYSNITASNSTLEGISAWDPTDVFVSNCTLNEVHAGGGTNFVLTSNCIINQYLRISTFDANYTVNGLKPGFFHYWNFPLNCSAVGSSIPNLTLEDTFVANWNFFLRWHTNATFSNSNLYILTLREFSHGAFYNTTVDTLNTYEYSTVYSFDSRCNIAYAVSHSRIWAINSTATESYIYEQAEVYVYYYLDVHVIDNGDSDVPYANVTAKYSNSTTAETKQADAYGWARLTLMHAKVNATGGYPVGSYTIIGEYEDYSDEASIEMFGNQMLTLRLPFNIPEFTSCLIILAFMATTLLAAIIRKRKTVLSKF